VEAKVGLAVFGLRLREIKLLGTSGGRKVWSGVHNPVTTADTTSAPLLCLTHYGSMLRKLKVSMSPGRTHEYSRWRSFVCKQRWRPRREGETIQGRYTERERRRNMSVHEVRGGGKHLPDCVRSLHGEHTLSVPVAR